MVAIQPLISEFTVTGKLEDLLVDSKGRVKYLYLSTPKEQYAIAVNKKQPELSQQLQPGCNLKVTGMRKNKLHRDEVEYKAYGIELLEKASSVDRDLAVKSDRQKQQLILVCQGKNCSQRGSQAICASLQREIGQASLNGVKIKTTGCMKQCKQAPQIIMPGRKRYGCVRPEQIATIVSKNLQ